MSEIRHTAITLEFRNPLVTSRTTIFRRRGFLLGIEHDGKKYVSESSVMPEFGTEHFEHAERILDGESLMMQSAPSAVFGLDCLRYAIEKKEDREIRVPIAMLLPSGTNDEVMAAARQATIESYDTVKLKVGFRKLNDDIELVNALSLLLPELNIRLDANLGWTPDDVRTFADSMHRTSVEWIEDPCRMTMSEWNTLQSEIGIALACDEAFSEQEILDCNSVLGFRALVLKPARLGAIKERLPLIERMRDEEIKIVLSSMFDSSVGLAHLAHLALEWSNAEVAHGLGTLQHLKVDTLRQGLIVEAGHLVVPPLKDLASRLKLKYSEDLEL